MYTLAKETKTGFRKQGSASQKKELFSSLEICPYYQKISLSPAVPEMEVTAHLFHPHCQQLSTSVPVVKERAEGVCIFALCLFSLSDHPVEI